MLRSSISCAALVTLLLTSSAQSDSLRRAKEAIDNKDFINAALIYSDEIDSLGEDDNETLNKLRLNAGLAYLEAKSFNKAEEFLNIAINESSEFEEIQSKALNALGNLYYYKANSFLDQQNVINAKKSWEKAREYYKNSLEIDTNASVQNNLES
jgi:tetratricopeptide (TPR) repeat protein